MEARLVWLGVAVLPIALLTLTLSADAEPMPRNLALDRYEPSPAGDAMLGVPDATVAPGIRPSFALMGVYSRDPVVAVYDDANRTEAGKIVTHQFNIHALAALDLWALAKLHIDVPFAASQGGGDSKINEASPNSAVMGDVRAGLRLALVGQHGWVPSVAANANVWFPSGDNESFTSSGSVRYALDLIVGADREAYLWRVSLGRRRSIEDSSLVESVPSSEIALSMGAALRFGPAWVGPELRGVTGRGNGLDLFERESTQCEVLLAGGARIGSFVIGASAGVGLTYSIGTPLFRGVFSVAYSPEVNWARLSDEHKRQTDQREQESGGLDPDGRLVRGSDRALGSKASVRSGSQVGIAGGTSGSAPVALRRKAKHGELSDQDGDGVPDEIDECPTVVGEPSMPHPGCPLDSDDDGIPDVDDACPTVSGVANDIPALHGCPRDTDGDHIIDSEDACPTERGIRTDDPATNGCPEAVRVVGTQIVISETIIFATGKDEVASESHRLLIQIAQLMEDHPEIARVAVDGHTDNVGIETNNLALSRRRAVAVVRWLVDHGVDERRLESRGFGPRRPLVSNNTAQGRARNRRVEFQILRSTKLGADGWKDGGIDE